MTIKWILYQSREPTKKWFLFLDDLRLSMYTLLRNIIEMKEASLYNKTWCKFFVGLLQKNLFYLNYSIFH